MISLSSLKPCNLQVSGAAFKPAVMAEHPLGRKRGVDKHNLLGNVCNPPTLEKKHVAFSATFLHAHMHTCIHQINFKSSYMGKKTQRKISK